VLRQVLDVSAAASATDLRPTRLIAMLRAARDFVRAFFDQVCRPAPAKEGADAAVLERACFWSLRSVLFSVA
jgi:hypothetical protein